MATKPTKVTDRLVEAMPWLDPVANAMKKAMAPVLGTEGPRPVKDFLYGTWLGHPLHPAVIALPIGFWTSTMVFDVSGHQEAADLSLKLGLLSAVGAAATGAAQWQDSGSQGAPHRLGALHASLNVGATALYAASWLRRRQGDRVSGIALSTAGLAIANASAWLGGDLAYVLGIGVSRTAFEQPPVEWTDVLAEAELVDGQPRRVEADGVPVMLLRQGDEVFAIAATCTHLGGPLDEGEINGDTVTCPWHGSVFRVRDGALLHSPATVAQTPYEVRVANGRIAVRTATPDTTRSTGEAA